MSGKIYLKTEEEIELIRQSSLLVGKTLGEVSKLVKPGCTSLQLDKMAEEFIRDHGAVPGFLNYNGFPNSLCISKNDAVVHGIPDDEPISEGEIISVDCGVLMNGFYGDSAYTFKVGEVSDEINALLSATLKSLYIGIENAASGNRVGDIGFSIQQYCESQGYGVVRELVGHGLGRNLHEAPEIPNYGRRGKGPMLKDAMVIAIEPMINMGVKEVLQDKDGWTIRTKDGKPSAHYEHTVVVRKGGAEILSSFEWIKENDLVTND